MGLEGVVVSLLLVVAGQWALAAVARNRRAEQARAVEYWRSTAEVWEARGRAYRRERDTAAAEREQLARVVRETAAQAEEAAARACEGCGERDDELTRAAAQLLDLQTVSRNQQATINKLEGQLGAARDQAAQDRAGYEDLNNARRLAEEEARRLKDGRFTAKEFVDLWERIESRSPGAQKTAVEAGRRAYAEHMFGPLGQHLAPLGKAERSEE